jgi:signal peptidase complex subunit 1
LDFLTLHSDLRVAMWTILDLFGPMDFEGQKMAELLMTQVLTAFGVLAFVAGYVTSDFMLMVKIMGVALVVNAVAVLPAWPMYRKNPLKWLPPLYPASKSKSS